MARRRIGDGNGGYRRDGLCPRLFRRALDALGVDLSLTGSDSSVIHGSVMLYILDADEEFLIGTRGNVLVSIWGRVTVERLKRARVAQQSIACDLEKKGFGGLVLVLPRRMEVTEPIEQQASLLAEIGAAQILANAVVIEGEGGLATVARTLAKSLQFIRGGKHPEQLFKTVDEAAGWLVPLVAPRGGFSFTPADLAWDVTASRAERRMT